ncbi:hypothetical protein [Prosthecomicrobium pneumaticum]|uniref:Uncharacterized protein n=1 Tax=Prosthecomicrobium pneumaticum TaxID=81895 RepID=A0A7W9FQT5_9HYPH|nr:hypothetical protein [Prosthecomicrobium pneumaticum]MBB5755071.1 hypothetical protein [Prosthecomicrobium pneumaticum]
MKKAAALISILAFSAPAAAQQVVDGTDSGLDPAVVRSIGALATRDFAAPADARLRNLKKSLARNGHGYCGEVSPGGAGAFVPFHAIVEENGDTSLLLLSDFTRPGATGHLDIAQRLLKNFGCTP